LICVDDWVAAVNSVGAVGTVGCGAGGATLAAAVLDAADAPPPLTARTR
jgi:hypothetical protein